MVRRKMVRRKMVRRWLIILTHTTDQALAWHVNKYGSQRLFVISRAKTVLLDRIGFLGFGVDGGAHQTYQHASLQ
jgi:hypothetical protein